MSFKTSMQNRYTVKNYDNTKKLEKSKIEDLKEILRLSPSSINSQPWKFTFVSETKTKDALAEASYFNGPSIKNCDTVIVFSRIDSKEHFEKHLNANLSEGAINYYNGFMKEWTEEELTIWFSKQVYLAIGVFLSACAEMGIDATPMEGIEQEKYNEILKQDGFSALVAVTIGVKDAEDYNQISKNPKSRLKLEEVVTSI